MKRKRIDPRPNWVRRLEEIEFFSWKHQDGSPYWVEDAYYELSMAEIEILHEAAVTCEALVTAEIELAIQDSSRLARLGLNEQLATLAQLSWRRGDPSFYGRFDFAWDGLGPPKLLEYNADTPTSLFEAAVVQWRWLVERDREADQYNSIHERLIAAWRALSRAVPSNGRLHFASQQGEIDDAATTAYLADCAIQAGISTCLIDIADIGLKNGRLVDLEDRPISHMFKLYPWEWLTAEDAAFTAALQESGIGVLEPPWRVAASSKGLLADLWRSAPDCPYLLPAYWNEAALTGDRVGKPILGREGANVKLRFADHNWDGDGPFADQPYIWQARAAMPAFDGQIPVFGVWIVAGEPCGLGIREDQAAVTGLGARFIPHRIE
jgi:glutathionylspermidine synthase